jgi:hypothetical protein
VSDIEGVVVMLLASFALGWCIGFFLLLLKKAAEQI